MEIESLIANNLNGITGYIPNDISIGLSGLSGSGKSTFCATIAAESMKRVVTLLPKSEYRFLFGDKISSNYSAEFISALPLVFYLGKTSFSSNPRSTVGTHTGIFREIREKLAFTTGRTTEFFSFNNSIMWCNDCKGRGTTLGHICKTCNGTRFDIKIQEFKIKLDDQDYDITQINEMNIYKILKYADDLGISIIKRKILENLIDLDVGYLSLDRVMSTLSGGETVRVLLAEFMAQCKNSIVIIDEVSVGLDNDTLINVIKKISILGELNQIWLIDHSDIVLKATEKNIFFGPGSGKYGGNIVNESPRPEPKFRVPNTQPTNDVYTLKGLKKRNIDINELFIFKNRLTTITGESGCGKSTLVNECIIPYFKKNYKRVDCLIIGQDRNQSITSKSTIASFLDLTKRLNKFGEEIWSKDLGEVIDIVKKDKYIKPKIEMLLQLGLGYLSFNRRVQTLSTGEFQCLHLVSKLNENLEKETILIFDEPSKGLSQNILNLLMDMMGKILKNENKTIIVIEHSPYFLSCSDLIIDFGKRIESPVTELNAVYSNEWIHHLDYKQNVPLLRSKMDDLSLNEVNTIHSSIDLRFFEYENKFKGGILKYFSQTAQWIYGDYQTDEILPIVAIDLEKTLYSKNTFLYEIAGVINAIIKAGNTTDTNLFDLYSKENLCECCNGTGKINTIDIETTINNANKGLWDGLLFDEIMTSLKRYNYSKIQFLFKEVKKETGYDLSISYNKMNEDVKKIFLYGYWNKAFYDPKKKTSRKWKGIIYLIIKYMRGSSSILKKTINESSKEIICPMCNGSILKHKCELKIGEVEIRDIITQRIKDNKNILRQIDRVNRIVNIIGEEVYLNMDVSTLSLEKKVQLKLLDLEFANLQGFEIVLKNVAPFYKLIKENIIKISNYNKVIILDYPDIYITKESILKKYYSKGTVKATSYVYEVLGYSKINTEINKIRKKYPCSYCKGRKVLREESIFEGVDITETPCHACKETGISNDGLALHIDGVIVSTWVRGTIGNLQKNIPKDISEITLISKINELNKLQLINLKKYKETNNVNL